MEVKTEVVTEVEQFALDCVKIVNDAPEDDGSDSDPVVMVDGQTEEIKIDTTPSPL